MTTQAAQTALSAATPRGLGAMRQILSTGLFALLGFTVLSFGAADAWARFVFESGALLLFLLWSFQVADKSFALSWNPLYPAFALMAAIVGIQFLLGLTVYRYATLQQAFKYVALLFLVLVADHCFRREGIVQRFGLFVSLFGFVVAAVALAQDVFESPNLMFLRDSRQPGGYGPYANRDHYAGWMALVAPFPLTLAMAPYLRGRTRVLMGTAAAVIVASLFLCRSRAGLIAFFAQAAFLSMVFARGRQHRRKVAITACVAFIVLAGVFAFVKGVTIERLATMRSPQVAELAGLRVDVLRDSRAMLAERPVLGWGLGSFEHVYPQFRSFYTNHVVQHAHNDYLEFLLETGIVGFAAVLWFVLALVRSGWKKLPQWKTDFSGVVKIAAMAGCIGILVHSMMGFNLQITSNAAWFYVLAIMVTANPEAKAAA
jgi:O-antigen ligase